MSPPELVIAGRRIAIDERPYVIAELSGNHNGQLERARDLITAARDAGADAVKLQTYTADTITIDSERPEFLIDEGLWAGRRLHELYQEAATPWEWHAELFAFARSIGITAFSTPFDHTAVDLLEQLEAPAYKIASFELVDVPLIERVAATGKPVIVSTGMATREEVAEAVAAARRSGSGGIGLLHCISSYPAPPERMNLRRIPELIGHFDAVAGLSDHSIGSTAAIAAVALGARIVEKHFTLARTDGGVDSAFSSEPAELEQLVFAVRDAAAGLGSGDFGASEDELGSVQFRRSLFVVRSVAAGETLTDENVRSIRPGNGLAPKHLREVLGRRVRAAVPRGTPLSWDLIEDL